MWIKNRFSVDSVEKSVEGYHFNCFFVNIFGDKKGTKGVDIPSSFFLCLATAMVKAPPLVLIC